MAIAEDKKQYWKEYWKEYRKNNSDKIKKYKQDYYNKHKDKYKEKLYKWREDNHEKAMLSRAKQRSKNKGYEFNLEFTDIIIPTICPALGIEITRNKKDSNKDNSPSLDRIDNAKGYIKGNVMIISNKANMMKNSATKEELIKFAQWVFKTYGDKE